MGFMDKAKKMAEQAQAKLDDVQKGINSNPGGGPSPGGPVVEYDKHGRPIASPAPPDAAAPPPHGDPMGTAAAPPPPPPPPPASPAPRAPESAAPPAPPPPPAPRAPESAAPPAPPPPAPETAAPPVPPDPPAAPSGPEEDRNNPSYEPPKLSSGDPLAGG